MLALYYDQQVSQIRTKLLSSQQTGLAWQEEPLPAPMTVMGMQETPTRPLRLSAETPRAPRRPAMEELSDYDLKDLVKKGY